MENMQPQMPINPESVGPQPESNGMNGQPQQQMPNPQNFGQPQQQMPNPQNFGQKQSVLQKFNPFKKLDTEPNNTSGGELIAKVFLGLVVGGIIAAILFLVLSFIGGMFTDALQQTNEFVKPNPLLPFLLLFIGFLSTFIGNMIVAGLYSLFYSKKYYDSSKMFGFLLLTNALLFFILAPIYLIFSKDIETLFLVLGFHVLFSVFVSSSQIEFLTNPNYSGSSLMGNVIGLAGAFLIYSVIYNISDTSSIQQKVYLFMLVPSILAYTVIPLGAGIWEKIYYKFYENGSNAFYIPSVSEVAQNEATEEQTPEEAQASEEAEINVEM